MGRFLASLGATLWGHGRAHLRGNPKRPFDMILGRFGGAFGRSECKWVQKRPRKQSHFDPESESNHYTRKIEASRCDPSTIYSSLTTCHFGGAKMTFQKTHMRFTHYMRNSGASRVDPTTIYVTLAHPHQMLYIVVGLDLTPPMLHV